MRAILIFAPYILVPLIVTLLFRQLKSSWKSLTFVLTAFVIFFYPFGLFWLDDYLNPPPPGPRCGNPQMGFLIGNVIILLPIALLLQFVFNKFLLTSRKKSVEVADSTKENDFKSNDWQ